jgi:FAD/FMN-containing dehydrogenase
MEFLRELKKRVSRNAVDHSPEALSAYSYDASKLTGAPIVVVSALSLEDITATVNIARQYGVPVVARGAGTGLSGGAVPHKPCVLLSLERMDRILHVDPVQKVAVVEPGVVNGALQERVAKYRHFFPCDPNSSGFSTLGGNAGENACGLKGRRYGSCFSHIKGLVYINNEGRLIATGYFNGGKNILLQKLLIGGEGTLGIITKLALGLLEIPDKVNTYLLFFKQRNHAFELTRRLMERGIFPISLEFIDGNTYSLIADPASSLYRKNIGSVVLLEAGEHEGFIHDVLSHFRDVELVWARTEQDRQRFWDFRNLVSPSLCNLAPDRINEDVAVPMNCLEEMADFLQELGRESSLIQIHSFGHLSVGCFHANYLFDRSQPQALEDCEWAVRRTIEKALSLGGTISCEHGIGLTKKAFLRIELGEDAYALNKNIKSVFDPQGLFNPGKVFEDD